MKSPKSIWFKTINDIRKAYPDALFNYDSGKSLLFKEVKLSVIMKLLDSCYEKRFSNLNQSSNSGLNPERTRSILNAWEQGKPILPPRLFFDGDKLFIEDGNHRLFAAFSLEEVDVSIELSFPQISTLEKVKLLEEFKFIV